MHYRRTACGGGAVLPTGLPLAVTTVLFELLKRVLELLLLDRRRGRRAVGKFLEVRYSRPAVPAGSLRGQRHEVVAG